MNYAGKLDATLLSDGQGAASHPYVHLDSLPHHAPSDAIVVPDPHFLFNADFARSGVDLILSKDDHELVLHDYFKGENRAALASPDGAYLTGEIVNALTGAVQYSQADAGAGAGQVIGHVTKLVGSATAIRNGVSIILNMGDNVEKGDVVQDGADSTLGITFIDGTVFGLASNARMVLNEMVYDPNGSNNSSLLSLVAGTITFVAGETAKHGDMKIDTPVATMGIRGTAVLVEIDFNVPGQGATPDAKFQVLVEPDGTTGSYILFDKTTLQPIAVVNQAGQQINISNGVVSQTSAPPPPDVQKLINDVFSLKFSQNDTHPKTTTAFNDTINPELFGTIKFANGTTATPVFQFVNLSSSSTQSSTSNGQFGLLQHIDGPPTAVVLNASGQPTTGFLLADPSNANLDTISGRVSFADVNRGDRPTVNITFGHFTFQNAQHQDITSTLSAAQLAEIAATEIQIAVSPDPSNTNNGSATWTYSIADKALNFLAAGQTLTLTYLVRVDNNYAPNDEATIIPITIAITGAGKPSEIWIATAPGGGLWSDAANWKTGAAPTANDDVIIVTDRSIGLTPSYPVRIEAPAFANSVTMNDVSGGAPELDNLSTLSINGTLDLSADSIIHNFGTISVGGAAEFLQQSVLVNDGALLLGHGGDFRDQSSITNGQDGTIEISGGTLNIQVDVGNSGQVTVDSGAMLVLNGGTIDGGRVSVAGTLDMDGSAVIANGSLAVSGRIDVFGAGDALENEIVTADGALEIHAGGKLTIGQGSQVTITDGTVTVDDAASLTLNEASLDGGAVTNESGGSISLTGDAVIKDGRLDNDGKVGVSGCGNELDGEIFTDGDNGAIAVTGALTLEHGASISGGTLANSGSILVETSAGAMLEDLSVDNTGGTIQVDCGDLPVPATLAIGDGTSITDGNLDIGSFGKLDVSSSPGATLSGLTVNNCGVVQIDADSVLIAETTAIVDGTLIISGTLDSTGTSALDGVCITNGNILESTGGTLTIDSASMIANTGTLEADGGNLALDTGFSGRAKIFGTSMLDLGATSSYAYCGATIAFTSGATGTLKLEHSESFDGTVSGLDDNKLDLSDIGSGQNTTVTFLGDASGGTLTIVDDADPAQVAHIKLAGDYLGSSWVTGADGSGGTTVTEVPGAVSGLDSNGDAMQGATVTASITDGGAEVSAATYDWEVSSDGVHWSQANGTNGTASYTPVEADEGLKLRVALTFTDSSGNAEISSASAGTVQESANGDLVATLDSGAARQDATIHVTQVTDGGVVTSDVSYDWQVSCDGVHWSEANGSNGASSYTPVEADEGLRLQLVVTMLADDPSGHESTIDNLGVVGESANGEHWTTVGTRYSYTPAANNDGGQGLAGEGFVFKPNLGKGVGSDGNDAADPPQITHAGFSASLLPPPIQDEEHGGMSIPPHDAILANSVTAQLLAHHLDFHLA